MITMRVHDAHSWFLPILIILILDVYKSFHLGVCLPEVEERGCNDNRKVRQKQS